MTFRLRLAVDTLASGGLIAYPTEAVWGLGCDPANPLAVQRLLQLKSRPLHKGLILVASDLSQLQPFLQLDDLNGEQLAALEASWPGPTSWLLPASANTPGWITGGSAKVAVRVSAHPVVRSLCESFAGAIVSTSANPTGLAPAMNALRVQLYFAQQLDTLMPGELGGASRPSEIRDLISGELLRSA